MHSPEHEGPCSGLRGPMITTTTMTLFSPFPSHPTFPPLSTWLCSFLKQKWKASWVLKVILLNIKLHHMHTFILKYFATFEASEAACLALPSGCFLPVYNPWLCFVTREGFSDAFLSWRETPEDTGSSAGKAGRRAAAVAPFFASKTIAGRAARGWDLRCLNQERL